jgi:signal transduction histidine kinase
MSYMNLRKQLRFNEQKDMFIANVSHELKTPVATAKVAIEALQQHDAIHHPERAERYLGIAGWELERLQTMMEKIMNSLPENEKEVTIQEAKTDIRPILFRLADIIQSMQKEPTVTFFWALPGTPVHISADELHFTNIIYNLLDNAVKYGGTEIHIAVDVDADNVTIKISDNGPGIPAEYRNKVFDRFFRIPSGNRHNVKGYGLGLSYVMQMVEAHKGTIRLATGPVTCFIIKWPKFKG